MKKIMLTKGQEDAVPCITDECFTPIVDSSYSLKTYQGNRLILRPANTMGYKTLPQLTANYQGMAVYGNLMVRLRNEGSSDHANQIRRWNGSAFPTTATWVMQLGHGNTAQFAPSVEDGNVYPYLYVAGLYHTCYVLSMEPIESGGDPVILQTITIADSLVCGNTIIGDDGYLWDCALNKANNKWQFTKFRKVAVSEGDITLTSNDIIEQWETARKYPYSSYIWQGAKVKQGKIFFCYGGRGNYGFSVFDTSSHALINEIDLSSLTTNEIEDIELWDDGILVATIKGGLWHLKF